AQDASGSFVCATMELVSHQSSLTGYLCCSSVCIRLTNTKVRVSAYRSAKRWSSGMADESGWSHNPAMEPLSISQFQRTPGGEVLMHMSAVEILLVEDNPGDVRLTREALKESKIRNNLSIVRDGVEAMAFLRREGEYANAPRPDIILLDLNLPRK